MDDVRNAFTRERLLPEAAADLVQHIRMRGVGLVENILQLKIRGAQTVAEVLSEYPPGICICSVLNGVTLLGNGYG